MGAYHIYRTAGGGVEAEYRTSDGQSYKVEHRIHHSPDGFEYGYSGSGPSDLAHSILADYLNVRQVEHAMAHDFRDHFIATLDMSQTAHVIQIEPIQTWVQEWRRK